LAYFLAEPLESEEDFMAEWVLWLRTSSLIEPLLAAVEKLLLRGIVPARCDIQGWRWTT